MPWTVNHKFSVEIKADQGVFPRKGTVYPWLPAIIDEETLIEITTLESGEHAFVSQQGRERRQYLTGLYLKAMAVLGHFHFQPRDIPLQFRRRLTIQLGCDSQLVRILTLDKGEKSRVTSSVRSFLGWEKISSDALDCLRLWLVNKVAKRETEVAMVVNAAVHYLRDRRIELPPRNELNMIAKDAINQAADTIMTIIDEGLSPDEHKRLELLTKGKILENFKRPVPQASPNNLAKELERIAEIRTYVPQRTVIDSTFRLHLETFAELTRRYTATELGQLIKKRQRALLLCYLVDRHSKLLDAAVDMAIRVWENTHHHANDYANARTKGIAEDYEVRQEVLKSILKLIQSSMTPAQLWDGVHRFKNPEEYIAILNDIGVF
jgi:hypothetical protein